MARIEHTVKIVRLNIFLKANLKKKKNSHLIFNKKFTIQENVGSWFLCLIFGYMRA